MVWSIFTDGGGNGAALTWADDLLKEIGAPLTTADQQFVFDWEKTEGGGGKYNPLNQGPVPGKPGLTTTGSQYGGGAADYKSYSAGLTGAVDYLSMPDFSKIKSDLKSGNAQGAESALWSSPWAASHYGYGSAWNNAAIPGKKSALEGGSSAQTDSVSGDIAGGLLSGIVSGTGVKDVKDLLERGGLIIFGGLILLIAVIKLTGAGSDARAAAMAVAA